MNIFKWIAEHIHAYRVEHHDCENHFKRGETYMEEFKGEGCSAIHQVTMGNCGICGKQLSID